MHAKFQKLMKGVAYSIHPKMGRVPSKQQYTNNHLMVCSDVKKIAIQTEKL